MQCSREEGEGRSVQGTGVWSSPNSTDGDWRGQSAVWGVVREEGVWSLQPGRGKRQSSCCEGPEKYKT